MKINSPLDDVEGESHEWKSITSKKCALKDKQFFIVLADVNLELLKLLFRGFLSKMETSRFFKFKSLDPGIVQNPTDHVSSKSYNH